jgi:lipopolysaccharide biosynthesis protein
VIKVGDMRREKARAKSSQENLRGYEAAISELLEQISKRNQRLSSIRAELSRFQEASKERENRRASLESELSERLKDPLGKLLWTYSNRHDLQQAFPEAREGDYSRLLDWAEDQALGGEDSAHQLLASDASWYEANPWHELSKLSDELNRMKTELSQRESNVQDLEAERSGLSEELNQVRAELSHAQEELADILGSFSYNAIRFFTKRIDRLLPDNTWRGHLRKKVVSLLRRDRKTRASKNTGKVLPPDVPWTNETRKLGAASLRILREEGMHSLLVKALEKIRRREFRILEASPTAERKMLREEFRNRQTEGTDIFREFYESMLSVATNRENHENQPISNGHGPATDHPKLIAFYLPQFHPIPENDAWWGKGFTEWTNVSKAVPQFTGHYQPRLPGELGFYDLRVIEVQKEQIELARQYGIHGFCYYYYWFDYKRLLERPLDQFLTHPELDFPFCLCWANENWTRRWDGLTHEILMAQNYSSGWDIRFIQSIENALRDKRYIRLHGRPLLIVYNPSKLPSARSAAERWRKYCIGKGIGDLYLVAAQTFGFVDPRPIRFDAAVEFPPHNAVTPEITHQVELLNSKFAGKVFDYRDLVEKQISRTDETSFERFLTVMPAWDNEARRPGRGSIFAFSTPTAYAKWLRYACERTTKLEPDAEKRLVFINSWNEWAEGAYLEPDRKYGRAYLKATASALKCLSNEAIEMDWPRGNSLPNWQLQKHSNTAVILHLYYPELIGEILAYLKHLSGDFDLFVSIPRDINFSEEEIYRSHAHVYVYRCENRGRDIAPFLRIFSRLYALNYDYMCKIHSKKTQHRADGDLWRSDVYSKLLGSPEIVSKAQAVLDRPSIGIVAPAGHVLPSQYYWGLDSEAKANKANVARFCREAGLDVDDLQFPFVAGSMFWFKPRALYLVNRLSTDIHDFEPEPAQKDGTLANAFERFFGLLAQREGFRIAEIDKDGKTTVFSAGRTPNYRWAAATKNGKAYTFPNT